jgi:DNA polymerase III sliding clamp (beta) subunit (PCNA family)
LRAIEEDRVQIKFTGPKSACTVRGLKEPAEGENTEAPPDDQKYLIVPLRGPA